MDSEKVLGQELFHKKNNNYLGFVLKTRDDILSAHNPAITMLNEHFMAQETLVKRIVAEYSDTCDVSTRV